MLPAKVVDPPYAIRTERLLIRCWEPTDAGSLKDAIDSSLDHLGPWMPWARDEPRPHEEKVSLLRRFRGQFDLGQDFVYGVFTQDGSEVVGGTGLHTRVGAGAFEIGYWIRKSRIGAGLATELSAALTKVAFEVCDVDRVEIRVDPANEPSARIPHKLGYQREARLRRRLPGGDGEPRDVVVFTIFRDGYASSPSAAAPVAAFDAAGARVL
ncbi:MAG TPA: GNAT family protein [Gaiellaceae bacterium]|nr:GNAT family protein [Gaiellaceae bacterium]